jgi:hypothetical protein
MNIQYDINVEINELASPFSFFNKKLTIFYFYFKKIKIKFLLSLLELNSI